MAVDLLKSGLKESGRRPVRWRCAGGVAARTVPRPA